RYSCPRTRSSSSVPSGASARSSTCQGSIQGYLTQSAALVSLAPMERAAYRVARLRVDDPSRAMKRAAARTAAAWLTHGLLFGFSFIPSRHRPRRDRNIRTVVFVHGLAGNRANFFPMQAYLRLRGHRRQLSFNYRTTGTIQTLALGLRRQLDRNVKGGR